MALTVPAASWTAAKGGPAFFACSTNYLTDLQAWIVVDVEATPAIRAQGQYLVQQRVPME